MTNYLHCPKCDSKEVSAQKPSLTYDDTGESSQIADGGLIKMDGDVYCLNCGYSWNPKEQILQSLDVQEQADALNFGKRKERFYTKFEAGNFRLARRLLPKEARLILKRDGLRAAYVYLKSLDTVIDDFKRTFWLAGITVTLLIVGMLAYTCR
ncbi:hypothetical protein [Spirosoma endophyticum]|uniref:Uncharacterized protein n=1 Tax=Spirosoma endophyticum TaxID=662367 RepID=A0A1I2D6D7_9BACT|nr:hypothetical protein [Spirosoma endophyticum]SFE76082.1 hypothetical protein SAMN05216167_11924 [Spirosoma endophyticum]